MPLGVAVGLVQFGNTNTLDGPQWVSSFEKEPTRRATPNIWTFKPKKCARLISRCCNFPAQKTVVVLPESEAADFLRTNGIQAVDGQRK